MTYLTNIEIELKKRLKYPYKWGIIQNNHYDKKTNFIYKIKSFNLLEKKINDKFKKYNNYQELKNYSLNRWYNFWSAKAVEYIFTSNDIVTEEKDKYHQSIDFYIENIPFDHKTSIFPQNAPFNLNRAIKNKTEFLTWLYTNQSKQNRFHLENRIFLILYDKNGKHWKLKSNISLLKKHINDYLSIFNKNKLLKLKLVNEKTIFCDIVWIIN